MSKVLNAVKEKFKKLKQNPKMRIILICSLSLLLIFSVTLAWYINNLGLWGMEFNTGTIDFNAYVYDASGNRLVGPVSPEDEDKGSYINAPLFTINNAQVGSTGTVYIAIESTGSIGVQYRVAFDVTGKNDRATAYLGGYKYNITKVTDKVTFNGANKIDVGACPKPDKIADEIVTIDRNAINGSIEQKNGYDVYRFDYTLANKNEEYTSNGINFYLNVFATQIGGDFDDTDERGYTYYCATREDIDRAKVEAYPGDVIKLTSNIVYYGDLVFNKPINLETNDFTLTVNGNLMYDYALGNDLRIDAGGLGQVVVQCTKEGVGGNLKIKAPLSDVTLSGSNASTGDFIVEKTITIDATNSFGAPGVSFNNVRIVDLTNSRKTILLESNTRATVSFGTTIGLIQTVVKANNIEIINNGVIGDINLSNMGLLDQTNSPQIYILNNNDINSPIALPEWSIKFEKDVSGKCTGNTRIIQSYTGSAMTVTGTCPFDNDDIEVEMKDSLVDQIIEGNDSRLKIYYQDVDGQVTSIQSILENYLQNEATTGCKLNEVMQLEIISVGTKAITNKDIAFMNSNSMLSLKHLDMQRADIYDSNTNTYHRLYDNAFNGVTKYDTLVLPQSLKAIGANALAKSKIGNPVTIPAGVTTFGQNWFQNGEYVGFASSIPVAEASAGMTGAKAVFVEEAYIDSYKNVYTQYATKIYPVSVLDESREHFVRNIRNNDWEITYYIRGEDAVIGEKITMDGEILSIVSVYDNAYRHNYTGTKVVLADSVENLGAGNFYNNKNITSVDLKNLKTLGDSVFYTCSALTKVEFSEQLEVIGANAFYYCTGLAQEVILPDTMQKIGNSAFASTPITKVNTGGAKTVDGRTFVSCKKLTCAEMPSVEVVGTDGTNQLFSSCSSLVSVRMPSLVKVNGDKMFQGCTSLRELYLGTNDEGLSLGTNPLVEMDAKQVKMFVPEEYLDFYRNKTFGNLVRTMIYPTGEKMGENLVNGFNIGEYIVKNNGDNTYSLVTSNISHSGKLTIPKTFEGNAITDIYENCFRHQSFIDVELAIGDNIKSIGAYAFYERSGLIKATFGKSLETIGSYAFANNTGLKQGIVLPGSMKLIDSYAFYRSGITAVNTGGTLTINDFAFNSCASLIEAVLPEVRTISEGGNNEVFESCAKLVSADMPKVALVNGTKMFAHCSSLQEIYMGAEDPNVSLGTYPFIGISTVKMKLYVPQDVVSFYGTRGILSAYQIFARGEKVGDKAVNGYVIGDYVVLPNDNGYTLVTSNLDFEGSVSVIEQYKGEPITKIGENAFRNQTFTDATLIFSDSVTSIETRAFYAVKGLSVVVINGVTDIGLEAFHRSSIKMVNGPEVTSIADSAFYNCTSLTTVNLPKIVNLNSATVFYMCTNLQSVYFENIMNVVQTTFQGATKLENITINRIIDSDGANMPSVMTIEAKAPCKIYVPYRSLSAYPSTWSGKPVVSFDVTAKYNGDTYVLSEGNDGRYILIDFIPSKSIATLALPATLSVNGANVGIFGIDAGAFSVVAATMKNVTLSASVAQLSNGALSECTSLENINVDGASAYFKSVSGVLYSKDGKMLVKYPAGRSGKFDMTATAYASTVAIGATAFENAKLTEIKFPATLTVIDSTAFKNCAALHTAEFTGTTPPMMLGANIFDTKVENFKMVIPTTSSSVVNAYLSSYNFAKYEPFIDLSKAVDLASEEEVGQEEV